MLIALILAAQFAAPVHVSVNVQRVGASCIGSATWERALTDADHQAVYGSEMLSPAIAVPCARLDAVDALIPAVDLRAGKFTAQVTRIVVQQRPDGTCGAAVTRTLTPVNAAVAARRGVVTIEWSATVACTRLAQALVGATITNRNGWPVGDTPLPLPES